MKIAMIVPLGLLALMHGCATPAGEAAYGIAADVKRSECRKFAEPRQSECLQELERRMERQEQLVREENLRRARKESSAAEQLEKAVGKDGGPF